MQGLIHGGHGPPRGGCRNIPAQNVLLAVFFCKSHTGGIQKFQVVHEPPPWECKKNPCLWCLLEAYLIGACNKWTGMWTVLKDRKTNQYLSFERGVICVNRGEKDRKSVAEIVKLFLGPKTIISLGYFQRGRSKSSQNFFNFCLIIIQRQQCQKWYPPHIFSIHFWK